MKLIIHYEMKLIIYEMKLIIYKNAIVTAFNRNGSGCECERTRTRIRNSELELDWTRSDSRGLISSSHWKDIARTRIRYRTLVRQ
jgi:hypothetical protein